jgi:hypothetical protein
MLKQRNNPIKVCRVCNTVLIVGENWTKNYANQWNYLCTTCFAAQRHRDNPNYKRPQSYNAIKYCRVCGVELTEENWPHANKKDHRYYRCRKCQNVGSRVRSYKHTRKVRAAALARYGDCCACCGESRNEFLSFDHINNDGYKERKHKANTTFYRELAKGPLRDDIQILCHNCNMAKAFYGQYPHQREKQFAPPDI